MATVRNVSGGFAILEGTKDEVLGTLYDEKVRNQSRVIGFAASGGNVLVMYSL